jgi:Kelch motif
LGRAIIGFTLDVLCAVPMAIDRAKICVTIMAVAILILSVETLPAHASTENSWANKASMRLARADLGVAVVNGKIYAIGGSNNLTAYGLNEEYVPAADTWLYRAPIPTPRSDFGIAVYQNRIYCIGGKTNGDNGLADTNVNEMYDPASESWVQKAPMPTALGSVQANVVGGEIYLVGGAKAGVPVGTVEVYSPQNDSWTSIARLPTAVDNCVSAVIGNKIFVISSGLTQIYNVDADSWSIGAPSARFDYVFGGATAGVFAPQRIYAFTAEKTEISAVTVGPIQAGFSFESVGVFEIHCYDPGADSWTLINSSMPILRYGAAVATVDDRLYVVGGYLVDPDSRVVPERAVSSLNEQYTPDGYGTVPPKISVLSPNNTVYAMGNASLIYTLNREASSVWYSLDGQANVTVTGNITIADLHLGLHNVTVYAGDTSGNVGRSQTVNFTVIQTQKPFPTTPFEVTTGAAAVSIFLIVMFRRRSVSSLTKRKYRGHT